MGAAAEDYARIGAAIAYLVDHYDRPPSPDAAAAHAGLDARRFEEMFTRWAGIGPQRFVRYLTLEHIKRALDDTAAMHDKSGLHELSVVYEAAGSGGDGLAIRYGVTPSPFGACFIGSTEKGICGLGFLPAEDPAASEAFFRSRWPGARLTHDPKLAASLAEPIFTFDANRRRPLRLHLMGTPFQLDVWKALLRIPPGAVTSYEALAVRLRKPPRAARAVGGAGGANPVSYLVPCHRVVRKAGIITGYEWGPERKRALLALEGARAGSFEMESPGDPSQT
ncbi:MAG: methylated-DNA--[protein]-cysteine S-methyltransferase [Alphaproteobacteria bacterium]